MSQLDLALGAAGALLVLGLVLVVVRRARSRSAAERAALEAGLRRSQEQVEALASRVEELTAEVHSARRASDAVAADREYVITTLTEAALTHGPQDDPAPRRTAPLDVETRVLEGLGRLDDRSVVARRVTDAGVSLLAAAHGVRRALRPEHLDRAAAEAHVARRRSRRVRRQELREARRLLRAVKAQRPARVEDAA
ncbi:hypothetical protein [Nocardioides marmoribigeumensis]|uniref:Uncharacterized protein n=1 Tax=Nocardioides marmoribigeumensis TaxID=433649 RepID=A0ABU2BQU6_9ACTN|nr:hypothetical protein [Nocardioides marmoribigeumensis]MDR7361015.1 hypothetical protein [Nocardioides marmoribigeumensis]